MTIQVFQLPDLGEGLTEAELVQWLVAVGDTITVDQPIAEVETAKALVEVPSLCRDGRNTARHPGRYPARGQSTDHNCLTTDDDAQHPGALDYREEERAGITVSEDSDNEASGNVLIGYGTSGGASTRRTRRSKRATKVSGNGTAAPGRAWAAASAPRVISPLVRLLAKRHGVDISRLTGSGPDGIILRADVMAAIDQPDPQHQAAPSSLPSRRPHPPPSMRMPRLVWRCRTHPGHRRAQDDRRSHGALTVDHSGCDLLVDVDVTELLELRPGSSR